MRGPLTTELMHDILTRQLNIKTAASQEYKSRSCLAVSSTSNNKSAFLPLNNRIPSSPFNHFHRFHTVNMFTWKALAIPLLAVSASAAPPHLEARKGAAPVGGPASAKVTIYSGYTCLAPGTVFLPPLQCIRDLLTPWLASTHGWQRRNGNHIHDCRSHMHNSTSWSSCRNARSRRRSYHSNTINHAQDWNRRL